MQFLFLSLFLSLSLPLENENSAHCATHHSHTTLRRVETLDWYLSTNEEEVFCEANLSKLHIQDQPTLKYFTIGIDS